MDLQRLEISRLLHRFGFGPRPGEFATALEVGPSEFRRELFDKSQSTQVEVQQPNFLDLGPRPAPNSPDLAKFSQNLRAQSKELTLWWLDQMVLSQNPLREKMVWFWHGHWATSIGKVNFAVPMLKQNQLFRRLALENFNEMSQAMLLDGALQIWLDGNENTVKAPNENLAREIMELFILGVNRYTENDVKEVARALTGYQVVRSSGVVTLNQRRRDQGSVTVLGKTAVMTGEDVISHLVSQENCAKFLAERLWYRFISSAEPLPANHASITALGDRNVSKGVAAFINGSELRDSKYSMVKSPVEWFVAVCRALELTPSKLDSFNKLNGYLDKLAQIPFSPPNVGGWPVDEAWLSSASAQSRIACATWLVGQADLSRLQATKPELRISYLADLLAVAEWTERTKLALTSAINNLNQLTVLAVCSPEYVVSQ